MVRFSEIVKYRLFDIAKAFLALAFKIFADRAADALFDDRIGVHERQGEAAGELTPDGGFSGAGEADKRNTQFGLVHEVEVPNGLNAPAGGESEVKSGAEPTRSNKIVRLDSVPATVARAVMLNFAQGANCSPY